MRDFLYALILLGSVQGVIICGLLLFSRKHLFPNRLLAGIIGLLTLPGFHLYFHYNGGYEFNNLTRFVHDILPMVIIMPIGPLIYFYCRSLLEPDFKLSQKEKLQFFPVIIDLLPQLGAWFFYILGWLGFAVGHRADYEAWDNLYSQYADIPRWFSVTIYLLLAIRYLQSHAKKGQATDVKLQRWLYLFTRLFAGFQIIWFFYLVPYILPGFSGQLLKAVDWFPIYIPLTILVYWLGIRGYLVSLQFTITKKIYPADWVEAAWQRLHQSMQQDRLYLDSTLTLEKVAGHTGLSTRQISGLLNQYRATNFKAFINQYRVEEFKLRVTDPGASQFTMTGLAMECGFNSAATFQRIFKQYTGIAPSAFLEKTGTISGETRENSPLNS